MEHLEETTLALYILEAPEVKEQGAEITAHLHECAGCAQLHAEMKQYYAEVDVLRANEDDSIYPALLESARVARSRRGPDHEHLTSLRRSTVQILVRSMKTYPVRWSGGFALVLAAMLLLMPRLLVKDKNPTYARAKDEFLIALNKNGDELWRKYMGPGFEAQTGAVADSPGLVDLDGNGRTDIIAVSPLGSSGLGSWMVCFNAEGVERWRFQLRHQMQYGKETFSGEFPFKETITIRDFSGNGQYEIAFAAHHPTWWPSVVGLLNAKDGKLLGEYWHSGWVDVKARDIDGDGNAEVFAWGYNNAFKKNALAILDPRKIDGHAPATTEYTPQGIAWAAEKFYVLLPDPDIFEYSTRTNVAASLVFLQSSGFEIRTSRDVPVGELGYRSAEVFFVFDDHLNCVKVRLADEFVNIHRRLEIEGKVKKSINEKYLEDLRKEVQYWDGERFVKEPTMNKKYGRMK
jgi:hypothetical protein